MQDLFPISVERRGVTANNRTGLAGQQGASCNIQFRPLRRHDTGDHAPGLDLRMIQHLRHGVVFTRRNAVLFQQRKPVCGRLFAQTLL